MRVRVPKKALSWRKFLRRVVNALVDLRVEGEEYIPEQGACLVATSHISRLDTPFLMFATTRDDTIGMVAEDYQRFPLFKWILDGIKVIWVKRGEYDFEAFREAVDYLRKGWLVGIAPEGTRSPEGVLLEGKPGAALLAERAKVKVLPASVSGSTAMLSRWFKLRKMQVLVRFGEPFSLPAQDQEEDKKNWLRRATDEVMARIAVLLPAERRGAYTAHPRVNDLAKEQKAKEAQG